MKICLDTNCFIDAFNPESKGFEPMQKILLLSQMGKLKLYVSIQNLSELNSLHDAASELANSIEKLPHYSIGSWSEQVGSWSDEAGTWEQGKEDDKRQQIIQELAKSGSSIRDRGGYIDAIRNDLDAFVTSDKQLVSFGPAQRLNNAFDTKVLTPQEVVALVPI